MLSSQDNRLTSRHSRRTVSLSRRPKEFIPFLVAALLIFSLILLIRMTEWPVSENFQFAFQIISITISTMTAAALIAFHYFKPNEVILIMGIALLGSSVLGAQHLADQDNHSFFLIASLLNSFLIFSAFFNRYFSPKKLRLKASSSLFIGLYGGLFVALSFLLQTKVDYLFPRESLILGHQILSAFTIFFLSVALIGFAVSFKAKLENFEFWLLIYICVNLSNFSPLLTETTSLLPSNFSEAEILRTLATLILLSGLIARALWIVRQESQARNELNDQNESIELLYSGTLIAANSSTLETAACQCLTKFCEYGKWELGHFYILDKKGDTHENLWYPANSTDFDTFINQSNSLGIELGIGFTGSIWAEKEYRHIEDLTQTNQFSRKAIASDVGLRSVLVIPVISNNKVCALLELFRTKPTPIDEHFLTVAHSVCEQLANLYQRQERTKDLVKQETLLKELFDSFPAGMATFDKDDRLSLFNQHFVDLNEEFSQLIVPNTEFGELVAAAAYSGQIVGAIGCEQEWIRERLELHKSGYIGIEREYSGGRHIRISEIQMASSGTIGIWSDVTEIRKNEKKLVSAMEMLKASLSGFPGGVCVFDKDMKLVVANKVFYSMLQLGKNDLGIGYSFDDFISYFRNRKSIYFEFVSELTRLYALLTLHKEEQTKKNITIGVRAFELHAAPVTGGGFSLSIIDITETQNYEISLRQARDLAEISARSAKEFAASSEAASTAKTNFLATMSHEIRTPMNGIMTTIDLLRETALSEDQSRYIKTIKGSAKSLLRLLNDILDISKIEANQLELDYIPVDLKDFLDTTEDIWALQTASKGLHFKLELDPSLPEVISTDPNRLQQIFNNLLSNAIKFTRQGTVSMIARPLFHDTKTDKLRIEVTDTGVGITEGNQKKLFRKFTQADSTTTRKYGGTGLGLSICRELVEMMGGSIGVDSEITKGTTVWFEIDLIALDKTDLKILEKTSDHTNECLDYEGPPLKILVAEDHPVNQAVMREILVKWQHSVDIVENGIEAVGALSRGDYDLILMDIQMPEMDGYTATKEIRSFPGKISKIPIIAVTANAMTGDRQKCLDAGMNDFISKPIERWELRDTLINYGKAKNNPHEPRHLKPDKFGQERVEKEMIMDPSSVLELQDMLGGKIVDGLIEKMTSQYEEQRVSVIQALNCRDEQAIKREAHMLKSSFGQFGLLQAAAIAVRVDTYCNHNEADKAIKLMPELIEKCDKAIIKLVEWRNNSLQL